MELETVIYGTDQEVALISLHRPKKLNAQNRVMARELCTALEEAEGAQDVKVVIMRGEGRAFCAGHDLTESEEQEEQERANAGIVQQISRVIWEMSKPVIAAVHGYALGAGLEWAMNCDMIIAAEGTRFGFPETHLGSAVGNGGTKLLPLLIGFLRAKEMVLSNRIIEADTAEMWGLVNRVVPINRLLDEALATARRIAENPTLSSKVAKTAINRALQLDFEETLEMELKDMVMTSRTGEFERRGKRILGKVDRTS